MSYWQTREGKQKERLYDKTHQQYIKKLEKMYRQSAKEIEKEMTDIYMKIIAEGEDVMANELYKYNRYYEMRVGINKILNRLGAAALYELNRSMEDMYKITSSQVLDTLGYGKVKEIDKVVDTLWDARGSYWSKNIWCADGLSADQRLVRNMEKLQSTLEKGMRDCVAKGDSKDRLVKTLQNRFGVSFSEADRLARTELTYVQNQSTMDSYKKAGVEQYQYMAYIDNRTSQMCEEMNEQIFNIKDAMVGVNYPPLHANCRCTTKAIIKEVNYES